MRSSKKQSIFSFTCAVATVLVMLGCGKGDDGNPLDPTGGPCTENWAEFYMDELQAFSDAAVAYSTDPTTQNCNSYIAAGNDYLDALEAVYDCVPTASRAQIAQAIEEAREDVSEACD